ncbi:TolC family protein [Flavobacterium faecale]|uniref:TolC family protein n=1 Tax=Flavobacterium faecale TaxID=1355330 RepID=UPI003AAB9C70
MLKNKYILVLSGLLLMITQGFSQTLSLDAVLIAIKNNNPQLKMYDADIQSMDATAVGAKSWMAPQVSTGFFMTPYNTEMWKGDEMGPGMGMYMIGVSQMFPNGSKLKADSDYMNAMSSVEKENKNYTLNQLNAIAKTNYYQGLVLEKKLKVAKENLSLLNYMIKSMEIRYQYNMDKLPTYYKAKSQWSVLESMIVMLQNESNQKRIVLNTLMTRDKNTAFDLDMNYQLKEYDGIQKDTASLSENRSDLKAIEKTMKLNQLKVAIEKAKLAPEFGVKYDHMFMLGQPQQLFSLMGMVTIPMPWSTKMNKATIESLKIKNESLAWQKQMILNEATGMISAMNTELINLNKQYEIAEKSIIPALKRNYDTSVLAWQNNTGDLFAVLDAWEALNMAQLDALDKLQAILTTQVEIEKQLENN